MIDAVWNKSSTEMNETTLVASSSRVNWLASAGNIIRSAGTSTMWRNTWMPDSPRAWPASTWVRGIACRPARTISVA